MKFTSLRQSYHSLLASFIHLVFVALGVRFFYWLFLFGEFDQYDLFGLLLVKGVRMQDFLRGCMFKRQQDNSCWTFVVWQAFV